MTVGSPAGYVSETCAHMTPTMMSHSQLAWQPIYGDRYGQRKMLSISLVENGTDLRTLNIASPSLFDPL